MYCVASLSDIDAIRYRDFAPLVRPMALYHNNGDGTFAEITSILGDLTPHKRTAGPTFGNVWGAGFQPAWVDFDNDGDEDLYIASGFLDDDPFNNRTEQPNMLLRNNGDGTFSDVSSVSGSADWGIARGVAYGDFNEDGCLDLYVANLGRSSSIGERAKLFQNGCDWGNNWPVVQLEGTESNRDGIGARVTASAGGKPRYGR